MPASSNKNFDDRDQKFCYLMKPYVDFICTIDEIDEIFKGADTIPSDHLKKIHKELLRHRNKFVQSTFNVLFNITLNEIAPRLFLFVIVLKLDIYDLFSKGLAIDEITKKISSAIQLNKSLIQKDFVVRVVQVQIGISPNTITEIESKKLGGKTLIAINHMINTLKGITDEQKKHIDNCIELLQRSLIQSEKCARILKSKKLKSDDTLSNIQSKIGTNSEDLTDTNNVKPEDSTDTNNVKPEELKDKISELDTNL